jgi:hypothetical protein
MGAAKEAGEGGGGTRVDSQKEKGVATTGNSRGNGWNQAAVTQATGAGEFNRCHVVTSKRHACVLVECGVTSAVL